MLFTLRDLFCFLCSPVEVSFHLLPIGYRQQCSGIRSGGLRFFHTCWSRACILASADRVCLVEWVSRVFCQKAKKNNRVVYSRPIQYTCSQSRHIHTKLVMILVHKSFFVLNFALLFLKREPCTLLAHVPGCQAWRTDDSLQHVPSCTNYFICRPSAHCAPSSHRRHLFHLDRLVSPPAASKDILTS